MRGACSAAASFRSRVGIPSCPGLLLVSSCLRRDSTSAGDVVMLDSVDVMTGVVWMGGEIVGLSVIDC